MDPQSLAFQPSSDSWRVQNDLLRIQQVQSDHSDRLLRLERRQEEDARMKSVWGGTSPFPSVLSGTPQQTPLQQPPADHFKNFDDESNNLMASLHLDSEEEPRRLGATSRAASVRFDESANQGHWAHNTRSSIDFLPRSGSSLGGLTMNERTSSHKSEGRASSVHSVRSATSGRASSLNMDTGFSVADSTRSPIDTPALAPGLLLLGSVPAIIRCWMNTNFKHDALLYAAICTGSHKSFLDSRLIQKLGFEDMVTSNETGLQTVELPMYFPEAVPHPASSRSSSPAPQLPSLTVTFMVTRPASINSNSKAIQIVLGSDTLRAHNADILFSSSSVSLYDDERNKLSIPLVRPESEEAFNSLQTSAGPLPFPSLGNEKEQDLLVHHQPSLNGLGQSAPSSSDGMSSVRPGSPLEKYGHPQSTVIGTESVEAGASEREGSISSRPPSRDASSTLPPHVGQFKSIPDGRDQGSDDGTSRSTPIRAGSSPAIWSNWRRDGAFSASSPQFDWSNSGKPKDTTYQRRDTGIKVLKPMRASTRTVSTTLAASPSAADGKSRFFDEGKKRSALEAGQSEQKALGTPQAEAQLTGSKDSQATAGAPKTRSNPAGGASAFAWLNSGVSK